MVQLCQVGGCGGTGWLPLFARCILDTCNDGSQFAVASMILMMAVISGTGMA